MKVASFVFSVSRKGRGMQVAVRDLTRHLHRLGVENSVFSLRDPWSSEDLTEWLPVVPRVFAVIGPTRFGYSPRLSRAARRSAAGGLDLIHLHGLWQFPSRTAYALSRRNHIPRIVSPHGMLEPWALARSARRKSVALRLWENGNLRTAQCLHALSPAELSDIRALGVTVPVAVIPNGVSLPEEGEPVTDPAPPGWRDERVMLYLSRIHPKKGLVPLLHAWRDLGSARLGWKLAIVGPDEEGHRAELLGLARTLRISGEVLFPGPVYGAPKEAWFRRADAFVLPSFSEGFPMAILEAMGHRLPVVLTPHCNIPEAGASEAMLVAQADSESLRSALGRVIGLTDGERRRMGEAGRSLVAASYRWEMIAARMKAVYEWLAGGGPMPGDVRLAD